MDNPFAFPLNAGDHGYEPCFGMTLRDWFAGQALAVLACDYGPDEIGAKAYDMADAMLAERNRTHD